MLVSPSTETALYESRTLSLSASSRSSDVILQSLVTKPSIVPILICIMPEPFAIVPSRTSLPAICTESAASLCTRSVVIIARRASSLPSLDKPETRAGIFGKISSMGICFPITPVDAIRTSCAESSV